MESEDDRNMKSLLSRLPLIKSDLVAIKRLDIENEEIRQITQEIVDKIELLFDIVFPGRKPKSK